jgi:hypothetical protein
MKTKSPTIKIQQKDGSVSANLMAFFPNLRSGRNRGYAVIPNDGSIIPNENSIHPDETGKYLYINELALPLSARVSLHKQSREKNYKPLIFDERAASVKFVWQ